MLENETPRRKRRPSLLAFLGLMFALVLTASVAVAGLPTGSQVGSLPTNQSNNANASVPNQGNNQEDPAKNPQETSPPGAINVDNKPSDFSPAGGTAIPTPCAAGSVYYDLEPNNTITTAQVLSSPKDNLEIRGGINFAGDVDYYSFVANAGDRIWAYAFTLGAVNSTDTQLQLLNALSQTLQFDDDNGSQADLSSAIAGRVVTQTATYYLRVNAFSSTSTISPYTLFVDRTTSATVPEVEPNNTYTQTQQIFVEDVITGSIAMTTDLDVYSFEFFDDDRYVFQVDGDPERDGVEFDPIFDLMNTAGAVLVTVNSDSQFDVREINSENAAFFIDTGGPPTSTLLIRIRPDGNTTGTYNLHIWRVGEAGICGPTQTATVTNTATPVCNTFISEVEPNNTLATSQMLPTLDDLEVRAPVNPAGDVDYYHGNATAGDKIWAYLFTGSSTSGADTELRILNAMSTSIQYDDDNGSQTAASSNIAGAPITTTGAIYFRVNEFNNDGTITPYSLFIDRTSSTANVTEVEPNDVYTQANMVSIGDLITGSIPITTDLDVFGFTVSAGDRIIFQADGDPERDGVQYNPNFQILDSAGTQLVAVDSDSTLGDKRSEAHAFTFGSSGTFYVRMSSDVSGPTTGTYNLHLWKTGSPPCASVTPGTTSTMTNTAVVPTATTTGTGTTVAATGTNTVIAATGTATGTVAASATSTVCAAATPFQETEPNNTIAQANALASISGAEVRGGITPAGDRDVFSFQANAGDRIWTYINTSNAAPSTDSILTLFNSMSTTIQLDDDNGFQSTLSSAIAGGVITQTGLHALEVRQFGGATIMNPYSLYINRTTSATVPEIEPNDVFTQANVYNYGTVVTGSIPITTDLDHYTFTLAQNEKIVIQVDGDPDRNGTNLSRTNQFNPNLDLLDANGALITAVDSDSQGGNGGLLSENLVYTNTSAVSTTFGVRIKFDPSTPVEDDTGIYNLHIYKVGGVGCPTPTVTGTPATSTSTATRTNTAVPPTSTMTATAGGPTSTATVCVPAVGTWVAVATAPPPGRYNVSGVVGTDGKFYVMTGQDSANAPVANNDVFDPATNAWTSAAPVPSPIQAHPALGSVSGKIYMSGGSVASTPVATTRIYDIATNTWSTGADAPTAFRAAQYATVGNNLYVMGGINAAGTPLNTTMIYNTATNAWSAGAAMPAVKFYGFAAAWGGLIYVFGGSDNTAINPTLYRYDPAADSWATLASGPNARIRHAMSARDGKLYATGGSTTPSNSFAQTNTVDVYDIASNTWSAGPVMTMPRNTHVQGTLPDGRIIVAVGLTTGNVRTQSAEVLPAGGNCPTPSVTVGATGTSTRTSTGTVAVPTSTVTSTSTVVATATCPPLAAILQTVGLDNPGTRNLVSKGIGPVQLSSNANASNDAGAGADVVSGPRNWNPLAPITFQVDDGTQEDSVGLGNGTTNYPAIWINRFSPAAANFPIQLQQISIQFPNPTSAGRNLTGLAIDLLVYHDTDSDNDPADATKLAQIPVTVTAADGVTFSNYAVNVLVSAPGDIYIGFADTYNTGGVSPVSFPAPLDTTASQQRSWVAGRSTNADPDYNNLGANDLLGTIDDFGLAGNWVIRASGESQAGGGACPSPTVAATSTSTATRTSTAISTSTNTVVVPSATRTNTAIPGTATVTPTVCVMPFTDVDIYNPFYVYIKCLYCRGIISGYADNTFRPYNDTTRGQMSKIVSNAAGFTDPVSGQTYTDVPPSHPFYVWIERLTMHGVVSGYNTGCTTGVPCFKPENTVTRGQMAKIVSNAAGYSDVPPAGTLTFTDVPPSNPFYIWIERLARRGIINGYPCGQNPMEPCDSENRPYYRPFNNITRGQASKIVANTFFPVDCTPGIPPILPGR